MRELTLFLDWDLNCQFAGLIWAMDAELFRQAGIDVRVVPPSAQPDGPVMDLMLDAPGALCTVEENLAVVAAADGLPVRAIGAMLQRSPFVLMTAATGGVAALDDLPGRKVAMNHDGSVHLDALLRLKGIDPGSVDVTVGGWSLDDLVGGRFDAVQGYAITEAHDLARRGFAARLVPLHAPELSPSSIVLVAETATIARQKPALGAMLRALAAGWDAVLERPEEAARRVAAWSEEHPDVAENIEILRGIAPFVRRDGGAAVQLDAAQWARNLEAMARLGMVPAMALDDVLDASVFSEG